MATWLRVAIGVIGSFLGAILGGGMGLLFAALVGWFAAWQNPQDPSAGAISIIGIATMPLGCIAGLISGPFVANWLVPNWTATTSRASTNEISGSVAACAFILVVIVLFTPVKGMVFGYATLEYTDVEFRIQVTDLATAEPIPNAIIRANNPLVKDATNSRPLSETLHSDQQGRAVYTVRHCPYTTSRGLFADRSRSSLVGHWMFTAEAPDYAPTAFRGFRAPHLKSTTPPMKVDVDLFLEPRK